MATDWQHWITSGIQITSILQILLPGFYPIQFRGNRFRLAEDRLIGPYHLDNVGYFSIENGGARIFMWP